MKKLITPLFVIVLVACSSSGSKETNSQDSTAVGDSVIVPVDSGAVEGQDEEASRAVSDTSKLEITFNETAGLVYDRTELFYTVSVITNQYEASSIVTWYFEKKDISPVYFKESWSAEGNEGSTEFFIERGDVTCAYTEDAGTIEKWCSATGGTRTNMDESSGESSVELIPFDYGTNVNVELTRKMEILKAILKEAEKTQEDEDSYTYRIEKSTMIGGNEVNESTEVSIPKIVYKSVMN